MYHSVSRQPENTTSYYGTTTHPETFERQMRQLKDLGYAGVTLGQGLEWLQSPSPGPARPAVVTFDDGFRNFLTAAVPSLLRYGFRATMYLPTGFIHSVRRTFQNQECLTWAEVKDLKAEGFEFGSHTVSHARLVELPWTGTKRELSESKRVIEDQIGAPVADFAYPYAFPQAHRGFLRRFEQLLAESGYRTCVTTRVGCVCSGDGMLSLKRLPVNSGDDARLYRAKLGGAYDWLGPVQERVKQLKRLLPGRDGQAAANHSRR